MTEASQSSPPASHVSTTRASAEISPRSWVRRAGPPGPRCRPRPCSCQVLAEPRPLESTVVPSHELREPPEGGCLWRSVWGPAGTEQRKRLRLGPRDLGGRSSAELEACRGVSGGMGRAACLPAISGRASPGPSSGPGQADQLRTPRGQCYSVHIPRVHTWPGPTHGTSVVSWGGGAGRGLRYV